MKKNLLVLSVLLEALLEPCVAGVVTNAYYRAGLETVGGVTRLTGLVKVQKGGDVSVPGTWTVPGGAATMAFENGRIVVKGKIAFDAGGAAFELTGRGVTFGNGADRWQIGLDGKRTNVTKNGFTLEPHPDTPGDVRRDVARLHVAERPAQARPRAARDQPRTPDQVHASAAASAQRARAVQREQQP